MPKYQQTVTYYKRYEIEAKNAAEANEKMDDLVSETEFGDDLQNDGYEIFEDEPVECPQCKGTGQIGEEDDEKECPKCKGDGSIPFEG